MTRRSSVAGQNIALAEDVHPYALSSDLARLCLPAQYKDTNRKLAWANSICFLFLLVGLVGIKAPQIFQRPLAQATDPIMVTLPPPEDQPPPPPEVMREQEQPQDTPQDMPRVTPVVAVAPSENVTFAVPVTGLVAIAKSAWAATPPPPANLAPSGPTRFNQSPTDGGSYPKPDYPALARRPENQYQGTVTLEIHVDPSGAVTLVKPLRSSGYSILDEAAVKTVKNRWQFPPGQARVLVGPITFQLASE